MSWIAISAAWIAHTGGVRHVVASTFDDDTDQVSIVHTMPQRITEAKGPQIVKDRVNTFLIGVVEIWLLKDRAFHHSV